MNDDSVIISRDGTKALCILEFEGIHGVPNRSVRGVYFSVLLAPECEPSRVCVWFSDTALALGSWDHYGYPRVPDEDERFVLFSQAAIGEYLDTNGLPPESPNGEVPAVVECFSYQFKDWEERGRTGDEEIVNYIKAKLYWSWKFDLEKTAFVRSDLLRLNIRMQTLKRVAQLGIGVLWIQEEIAENALVLSPTPAFLAEQEGLHSSATDSEPDELLLEQLRAPRYSGPYEHWKKSIRFATDAERDLPNALKEAVCAVEGLARVITGEHKKTLGNILKILKHDHSLPSPIVKSLEGVWGYASDSPGVRHGGSTRPHLDEADVRFAIGTCREAMLLLLARDTVE